MDEIILKISFLYKQEKGTEEYTSALSHAKYNLSFIIPKFCFNQLKKIVLSYSLTSIVLN